MLCDANRPFPAAFFLPVFESTDFVAGLEGTEDGICCSFLVRGSALRRIAVIRFTVRFSAMIEEKMYLPGDNNTRV